MIRGRRKLSQLHPAWRELVPRYLDYLDGAGVGGEIFDVFRSPADQDRRFARGETNARAGESAHNVTVGIRRRPGALAFDFVTDAGEASPLQQLVHQWWSDNGFGVIRGGVGPQRRPDLGHVEYPDWRSLL